MSIQTKETTERQKAQPPTPQTRPSRDPLRGSQLVSFGDRVTYTFSYGPEVGSIHYDRARGEIFFKGHNVRNMEMEDWQLQVLEKFRTILTQDEKGRPFAETYGRALDKIVLEKKKTSR